jgi:hypothetical protein
LKARKEAIDNMRRACRIPRQRVVVKINLQQVWEDRRVKEDIGDHASQSIVGNGKFFEADESIYRAWDGTREHVEARSKVFDPGQVSKWRDRSGETIIMKVQTFQVCKLGELTRDSAGEIVCMQT